MPYPTVYPTGTTIYKPEKCFNGFTIFPANGLGAMLIDMNGREVNLWKDLEGMPNKILPGGYVMGARGLRNPKFMTKEYLDVCQIDWDGNIVWKFDHNEFIEDPGEEPRWMARQKADYQREGNPVGYYVPGMDPYTDHGNTLILCHRNVQKNAISRYPLIDDAVIEVDWEGNIIWEWRCSDHFKEFGFSEAAKNVLARDPNLRTSGINGMGDWLHVNSMSALGPNKWYDAGDERFHPDNIIMDARQANCTWIVDKKSGDIVWKIGPDYENDERLKEIGQIIGQHHAHMIPKGLPGEGNIMIFDNGGTSGYGLPNPMAPHGFENCKRDYSRVIEFDPITFEMRWQYTPKEAGFIIPLNSSRFYSPFISSAQRLPNGNTLITEGGGGRLFEVTRDYEIVWEYISPYYGNGVYRGMSKYNGTKFNAVYRAYRVPYEYCPQAGILNEVPIEPIDNSDFRMPGAAPRGPEKITIIEGTNDMDKVDSNNDFCLPTDEQKEEVMRLVEEDK